MAFMKIIYIVAGTQRRPKLNAVWEAVSVFGALLDPDARFEVVGVEVESGVTHTPLSREETMTGARQRAETLMDQARKKGEPWEYFVGLEGGLDVVPATTALARQVFLHNWAYVSNREGRGAFGQSGAIVLPESLAATVVDEGVELSQAIDAYAGGCGIRDAQGAWGVLSRNMITRQDAFRTAVINAFAPFYNPAAYPAR